MYVSLRGEVYIVGKLWKSGQGILIKVPNKTNRNFDYMTIDSVLKSYEQYGITYACDGDFTSIQKEFEF